MRELYFAARRLGHSKLISIVVILTLALGIGANTAIFSVLNAVVLRPLPYPNSERLVGIWSVQEGQESQNSPVSFADFLDWREKTTIFDGIAVILEDRYSLTGDDNPLELLTAIVSPDLFRFLGVEAQSGRTFLAEEEILGNDAVALISHGLWQRRFGSDPAIVGTDLILDGQPLNLVGVLPPDFTFPSVETDLWLPMAFTDAQRPQMRRGRRMMEAVGRLRPGLSLAQAQANIVQFSSLLAGEYAEANSGWSVRLQPLHEQLVGSARPSLLLLLGAAGIVLLLACLNVAGLLLARIVSRQPEQALRVALGAGRMALSRPAMAESCLLGLAGGIASLGVAYALVRLFVAVSPHNLYRLAQVRIDGGTLWLTFALSLLCALSCGFIPALWAYKSSSGSAIIERSSTGTVGHGGRRVRAILVVTEVALALLLLVGAGLLIRTLHQLRSIDPGFATENRLVVDLTLSRGLYPSTAERIGAAQQLSEELAALPGVTAAAHTSALPMSPVGLDFDLPFSVENRQDLSMSQERQAQVRFVSPAYAQTMGIPLLSGRAFDSMDLPGALQVALINQTMKRLYWPDSDPRGSLLSMPLGRGMQTLEIVGVLGDVRHYGLNSQTRAEVYVPYSQFPLGPLAFVIHSQVDPSNLSAAIRDTIWSFNDQQPISRLTTLRQVVAGTLDDRRLNMRLLTTFAFVATLLAAIGVYAMIAFGIQRRSSEFSLRRIFGANSTDILRVALWPGLGWILAGLTLGLVCSLASSRMMSAFVYGVSTLDPWILTIASLLLACVSLLGISIPAWRATRVDPTESLRQESLR